ncbi:MAG: hypothetical protein U0163_15645 [Gemmatimonadaceae bacterium]
MQMMAARVVVGFDDARKVIILHDPSFGPAMERRPMRSRPRGVPPAEERRTSSCPKAAALVASHAKDAPYRARSADERAAERYAMTYAAVATGQFDVAEKTARDAVKMLEASDGYRHMLNLSWDWMLKAQNRAPEAIAVLEESLKWVNDSPMGWQVLSQLYKPFRDPGRAAHRLCHADGRRSTMILNGTATGGAPPRRHAARAVPRSARVVWQLERVLPRSNLRRRPSVVAGFFALIAPHSVRRRCDWRARSPAA